MPNNSATHWRSFRHHIAIEVFRFWALAESFELGLGPFREADDAWARDVRREPFVGAAV